MSDIDNATGLLATAVRALTDSIAAFTRVRDALANHTGTAEALVDFDEAVRQLDTTIDTLKAGVEALTQSRDALDGDEDDEGDDVRLFDEVDDAISDLDDVLKMLDEVQRGLAQVRGEMEEQPTKGESW